jgi:hypothetical protein
MTEPDESVAPPTTPAAVGPLLPETTSDDTDAGWGEQPAGFDDDHYLRDRPPHHGD